VKTSHRCRRVPAVTAFERHQVRQLRPSPVRRALHAAGYATPRGGNAKPEQRGRLGNAVTARAGTRKGCTMRGANGSLGAGSGETSITRQDPPGGSLYASAPTVTSRPRKYSNFFEPS
jgi:hypothetical protein